MPILPLKDGSFVRVVNGEVWNVSMTRKIRGKKAVKQLLQREQDEASHGK